MSATTVSSFICPCCKKVLDSYVQAATRGFPDTWLDGYFMPGSAPRPETLMGTCKTVGCDYRDVTLSQENWVKIETDAQMQDDYRGMYEKAQAY